MVYFHKILYITALSQICNISAADPPSGDNVGIPLGDAQASVQRNTIQPITTIPIQDSAVPPRYDPSAYQPNMNMPVSMPYTAEMNHPPINPPYADPSHTVSYQNESNTVPPRPMYYSSNFLPQKPVDTINPVLEQANPTMSYPVHYASTQNIIPQNPVPQVAIPQIATPQVNIPQIATPQVAAPHVATPQVNIPQVSTPQVSIPQNITLPNSMPQHTIPQNTQPQNSMPLNTVPQNMMPNHNNTPTYPYNGSEINQQGNPQYAGEADYQLKKAYESVENQMALQNAEIQRHQELLNQLSTIAMPQYNAPPQNYPLTSQIPTEIINHSLNSYLQQLPNDNTNQGNVPYMTPDNQAMYNNVPSSLYNTPNNNMPNNAPRYPMDSNPTNVGYQPGHAMPNQTVHPSDHPMVPQNLMYENVPNNMNNNMHPLPNPNMHAPINEHIMNEGSQGLLNPNLLNPSSFLGPVTNSPIVSQLLQFPPLTSALQSVGLMPGNMHKGEEHFMGLNPAMDAPMRSAASMATNINPGMLMAQAGQFINAGQTLMNASNAVMNSLPMEQILGASQQIARANEAQESAKYNPELQPVVRCASAGITCCIPEQYLSGEWKRTPPVLNDMPDDNKVCRAHFIPMQNSLCATTTYEGDNLCGLVKGETHDYIIYRHVLTLRGKTKGRAVCECRWRKEFHNPTDAFGEVKDSNKEMPIPDPDTPPVEGFAIWEVSKKEKHEAERNKQNAARFAQGLGATIKVAKLLGEKMPTAIETVQGSMEQRTNTNIQGAENASTNDPTSIISAVANAAASAITGSNNLMGNTNNSTSSNNNKQVDWVNKMADIMMEQGGKTPGGSAINRAVEDFLELERSKH